MIGTYDTLAEAEKRLQQIEMFKRLRAKTPRPLRERARRSSRAPARAPRVGEGTGGSAGGMS